MPWPAAPDFREAVQNPQVCFRGTELERGEVAVNHQGLPLVYSGSFACVYKVSIGDRQVAMRCFTQEVKDQHSRYNDLSEYLRDVILPAFVGFECLEEGIRLGGSWYPVVKMDWVEGEQLSKFVGSHLHAPGDLGRIPARWRGMTASLRGLHIAHNDLQHGNVMVQGDGNIRLVDYDGIFLPKFRGDPSPEVGHRNYQHPQRSAEDYDDYIDNFPSLVIYLSLLAIASDPSLWSFYNEENLLFTKDDYADPGNSECFKRLKSSQDATVANLAAYLEECCSLPVGQVPDLETILLNAASAPIPTTAAEPTTSPAPVPPASVPNPTTPAQDVQCSNCNRTNSPTAKFCTNCGSAIITPTSTPAAASTGGTFSPGLSSPAAPHHRFAALALLFLKEHKRGITIGIVATGIVSMFLWSIMQVGDTSGGNSGLGTPPTPTSIPTPVQPSLPAPMAVLPTSTPAPTATPMPTAKPTPTPAPTPTPVPPTPTPAPTAAPYPTAAPTPEPTPTPTTVPTATPIPTPTPALPRSHRPTPVPRSLPEWWHYSNDKYGYMVPVPPNWTVDAANVGAVRLTNPNGQASVSIIAHERAYPSFGAFADDISNARRAELGTRFELRERWPVKGDPSQGHITYCIKNSSDDYVSVVKGNIDN